MHSLVQEKMEGISIEVGYFSFYNFKHLFISSYLGGILFGWAWSNLIPLQVNEDDLTDVQAVIDGPPGTPYQGAQIYPSPLPYYTNVVKYDRMQKLPSKVVSFGSSWFSQKTSPPRPQKDSSSPKYFTPM